MVSLFRSCWEKKNGPQFRAEAFEEVTTFDLSYLEKIEERYEDAWRKYDCQEDAHKNEIVQNEMNEDNHIAYEVAGISASERPERVLHSSMYSQLCFNNRSIAGFLRQLRLFLVEKRWGFVEESFGSIISHQLKEPGPPWLKEQPMSLRQMFGDPEKLVEIEKKAKAKKHPTQPKLKRFNAPDAITAIREIFKEMVQWLRAELATMSDKPTQIPSLPKTFECDGLEFANSLPRYIRQMIFDLAYLFEQIVDLDGIVKAQVEHVKNILSVWFRTGKEAWDYGKKHIHEMPAMRKYEYNRLSYEALIVVAGREHSKMVSYFKSEEGAPFFTPEIAHDFNSRTREDYQRSWEARLDNVRHLALSVDELVADYERRMRRKCKMVKVHGGNRQYRQHSLNLP